MKELISFVGYVLSNTKDEFIRKRAEELLKKYWKHPKD